MKLTFTIMMFCLSISTYGYGRQPAVESFVGVEPSGYIERAPSSEKPFNFSPPPVAQERAPVMIKNEVATPTNQGFTLNYFFILAALITLPFAVWQMIIGGLTRKKIPTNVVSFPQAKKEKVDGDDDWTKKAS